MKIFSIPYVRTKLDAAFKNWANTSDWLCRRFVTGKYTAKYVT